MNLSKISVTKTALLKLMVTLGIIVNLALVTGGVILARVGPLQASPSMASSITDLEEEIESLQAWLYETQPVTIQEAESRALTIFQLAEEQRNVQVWNLLNETQQEKMGRRDVEVFITFLELRGPYDEVLALIGEIQKTFRGNLVTENVDVTGPADAWRIRLSLKQVIED